MSVAAFWNGRALLIGEDASGKNAIPLMMVNWKIKLGISNFININLSSSSQTIVNLDLTKKWSAAIQSKFIIIFGSVITIFR